MPRPLVPDRRERILDAARDLLLARGPSGTTVAEVAAAAGIGKGAVYREFPDKTAVLAAVLDRASLVLTAEVRRRVLEATEPVDLVALYRIATEAMLADPLARALWLGDEAVLGEAVAAAPPQRYRERMAWLEDYALRLRDAGVIATDVPVPTVVRVLAVFTVGLVHAPGPLGARSADELAGTVALFAEMVRARLAPPGPIDAAAARAAHLDLLARLDDQLARRTR